MGLSNKLSSIWGSKNLSTFLLSQDHTKSLASGSKSFLQRETGLYGSTSHSKEFEKTKSMARSSTLI